MNAHRNRGSVGQLPMREPTTDIGANIDVSHSDTDACAPVWLLLRLRVALVATIAVTSISVLCSVIARRAITPIWAPRWRSSPIVFLVHSVSSVVGPLFGVRRSRCQGQCAQASYKDHCDDALHGVVSFHGVGRYKKGVGPARNASET